MVDIKVTCESAHVEVESSQYEKIAEIYLTGEKEKANIMFKESVSMMKVARWELIAMQDQIRYLVTKENQNA